MTAPVKAKAVVIDPASMTVVWANESAAQDLPEGVALGEVPLDRLVPIAEVPDALREVAATGEPRHLQTGLVSTVKGGLAVVTSIYRLPGGMLLMLTETAWQPKHGEAPEARPGRRGRRGR